MWIKIRQDSLYQRTFQQYLKTYGAEKVEEVATVEGESAALELEQDWLFVRCKITSSKLQENPIENLLYEMAWTQPVQYH